MAIRFVIFYSMLLCANNHIDAQNLVQNYEFNNAIHGSFYPLGGMDSIFSNWQEADKTSDGYQFSKANGAHDTNCLANNIFPPAYACPGSYTNYSTFHYFSPTPYAGRGYGFLSLARDPSKLFSGDSVGVLLSYSSNYLKSKLKKDSLYCTEIHVQIMKGSRAGEHFEMTDDGLGLYFSDNDIFQSLPWKLGIQPQVGNWGMIDTVSQWQKLRGSFIADGTEEYLHIGNFDPFNAQLPWRFTSNASSLNAVYGVLAYDAVYVYNCRDTLFSILQEDTTVCYGQPAWLAPQLKGFKLQDSTTTYNWETPTGNFTTQDTGILATQPGEYKVEAIINKRFKSRTTFTLHWLPPPPVPSLLPDTLTICLNQNEVSTTAPYIFGASYLWPSGDTTRAQTFTWAGLYNLQISTKCWLYEEEVYVENKNCGNMLYVPNAFSPNGDGVNDYFEIYGSDRPIDVTITDRWGRVVLRDTNYKNTWDGTYNGQPLEFGVYTYVIYWSKDEVTTGRKMGTVTILQK